MKVAVFGLCAEEYVVVVAEAAGRLLYALCGLTALLHPEIKELVFKHVAFHEAGHAVAAYSMQKRLGLGDAYPFTCIVLRKPDEIGSDGALVTVESHRYLSADLGLIRRSTPAQRAKWRREMDADVIIDLSGLAAGAPQLSPTAWRPSQACLSN